MNRTTALTPPPGRACRDHPRRHPRRRILYLAGLFGLYALARRRRVKDVTSTRLPRSRAQTPSPAILLTKSTATLRFPAPLRPCPPIIGRSFGRFDEMLDLVRKTSCLTRSAASLFRLVVGGANV
jgi:hypothetical protein